MRMRILILAIISIISIDGFSTGTPTLKEYKGPMKIRKRQARPDIPGTLLIELGFNLLQNNDPSIDIELLGSRTLNLTYLYEKRIGNTNFFVMPGIGVGMDRYKFDEDVTLSRNFDNTVSFDTINTGGIKKSMLVTNYLDIPLEVRFLANPEDSKRSFKVGVGFKAGILLSSHTKIKADIDDNQFKTKVKNDFNLNRFRYGVVGRIGVGGFNVFYYQSLNALFEKDKGPIQTEANNITIGLSFTGF